MALAATCRLRLVIFLFLPSTRRTLILLLQFVVVVVLLSVYCRLKAYILYWLFGPKNQSFRNKSGKTQPIRTEFGIRGQVKGWQRSGNFGRDRPILDKMEAGTSPAEPEFFCLVNYATFRQHRNRRFSPNLDTFSKIFTLWVICPQNLKSKLGQTGTSLKARYRSHDALQRDTVYSTL